MVLLIEYSTYSNYKPNGVIIWLVCYFPRSSFANQGEICLCTSRVYVQKGIYDQFLEKFVEQTRYTCIKFKASVLHCTSVFCTIFVSLAHAHDCLHSHNITDWPQAKLDSKINACFVSNEHGDLYFFST